jgi:hypothetical protein
LADQVHMAKFPSLTFQFPPLYTPKEKIYGAGIFHKIILKPYFRYLYWNLFKGWKVLNTCCFFVCFFNPSLTSLLLCSLAQQKSFTISDVMSHFMSHFISHFMSHFMPHFISHFMSHFMSHFSNISCQMPFLMSCKMSCQLLWNIS